MECINSLGGVSFKAGLSSSMATGLKVGSFILGHGVILKKHKAFELSQRILVATSSFNK